MSTTKVTHHSNSGTPYETRVTDTRHSDGSRDITVARVDRSLGITTGSNVSTTHVKPNGDSRTKCNK